MNSAQHPTRFYDRRSVKTLPEQLAADLCKSAGVRYKGIQKGFGVVPDQVLFDNDYGSTLCLPFPGLSIESIHEAVVASNAQWRKPNSEAA